MTHNASPPDDRCRLVLVISADAAQNLSSSQLVEILSAGDVASIIFTPDGLEDTEFQPLVEPLIKTAQAANVAAIVADSTRVAGRCGADGFQLGQDPQEVAQAVEKFSPKIMVGVANVKTRHNALVIGELQPDYLMFGKPGGDIRSQAHPKNLDLGQWWSSIVEIPCIVMGGNEISSVVAVAQSGCEFVALGAAIFAPQDDAFTPAELVKQTNKFLDDHAPTFEVLDD